MDKTANLYIIGGSPCSGKSTIAEILAKQYDLFYYKVDENLDRFIKESAGMNKECCSKVNKMTPEEIWMRDPGEQCKEEFQIYEEIFDLVMKEIQQIDTDKAIITEGAAFVPNLMKKKGITWNQYLSITPARDFQISHYKKREWVPYILEECRDKQKAFDNWMERDCLFAKDVQKQCAQYGYLSYVNKGEIAVNDYIKLVATHFGLDKKRKF